MKRGGITLDRSGLALWWALPYLFLSAPAAWALEANQIEVLLSDGTPIQAADGIQVRGYNGSSWVDTAVFLGNGLFEFDEPAVSSARVIKDGISGSNEALGGSVQLIDFRMRVNKSPQAGGLPRSVDQVRLYQGSSWRSNFAYNQADSSYSIDVVDGVDLRAFVIKNGIGAYTSTVRPADSDQVDVDYDLVDFRFQVLASPRAGGHPRSVDQVRLYQGSSWRTNFGFQASDSSYHVDVVDGVDLRAYVIQNGIGAYAAALRPADSDQVDGQLQLVDFRVDVHASPFAGGGKRGVDQVRLYQGSSWRSTFSLDEVLKEYHIDVVPGVDLRAYVIKNGIGAYTESALPADSEQTDLRYDLVDYRVDVHASPVQGGNRRNVDQVRLYQGTSWRSNLGLPGDAGKYHIDVVDGVDLRAYVILNGIGAYTQTCRPADAEGADTRMDLVDFDIALDTESCDPVSFDQVRLYQGNSWRSNFPLANPQSELHHDVVPGATVRAYLVRHGIGVFTESVQPANGELHDLRVCAPRVTLQVENGPSQARLYQGNSWRATLQRNAEGNYSTVLVEGMGNLRFWLDGAYGPVFSVAQEGELLHDTGDSGQQVSATAESCIEEQVAAAVELQSLNGVSTELGTVRLDWSTLGESGISGFVIQRGNQTVSGVVPATGGAEGASYFWVDEDPPAGVIQYTILEIGLDGSVSALASIGVEHEELPQAFGIQRAWPNPFNPTTTLQVAMDRDAEARLAVYNSRGALVRELHSGRLSAGRHEFVFSGGKSASGLYLVVLEEGNRRDTRKLLLVK